MSKTRFARSLFVPALLLAFLGIAATINYSGTAFASDNPIVVENQQPGSDAWRLGRDGFRIGDDAFGHVKGYASATSVNKGESISFHVATSPIQMYEIDIYRIGWYGGKNGRHMMRIGPIFGTAQPPCLPERTTGLIACNWVAGHTLTVPDTWTSGVYLALVTNQERYQNYIIFVVRDDNRRADLLYQQSVTTYQAYNNYPNDRRTGKSLYPFNSFGANTVYGDTRAVKVSFDRPYALYALDGPGHGSGQFLVWEIFFVSWMERNGYDVVYSTDVDTHANGRRLLNYRGFLSVGHDEYWSKAMYDAAEAARDAGVNLAFFGANDVYWQVRFEPNARGVPNRVMVCYKRASIDPVQDSRLKTVRWREAPLNRPEQRLIGIMYTSIVRGNGTVPYIVSNSNHWVYTGTGFRDGDRVPGIVGYETDRLVAGYARPVSRSSALLSQSPLIDVGNQPSYANSSIYEAPSGARVFAAGTISWSWGLDRPGYADARIQRTTANILNNFLGRPLNAPTPTPIGVVPPATATPAPSPTPTVEPERCFPETNQCVGGEFGAFWQQNGGLPVFGLAVTAAGDELNRDSGLVHSTQWFERARFEAHPENQPPYNVLLGRLGDDRLRQMGIDWQLQPRESGARPNCLWFDQTGFNVCDQELGIGFRSYWLANGLADPRLDAYGRSLALFGLPLGEPRMETNSSGDTVLTQWFERARFEYHPANPPEFRVLLGLLGNEVRAGLTPPVIVEP